MCHGSRDLLLLWTEELVPFNEPWMYICTIILSNYNGRQVPRSKCCNTVWYICHVRSVWLYLINTSIHVSLYALCVPARPLYVIVHWLSFRHMSSYGIYSSLEEAFEFCWSLFAGEVKLNKFEFETQGLLDLLCKHLEWNGISVSESQRFLLSKCQKRWGARRNGCFRRLIPRQLILYPPTWNLTQSPAICKWLPTLCQQHTSRNSVRNQWEYYQ